MTMMNVRNDSSNGVWNHVTFVKMHHPKTVMMDMIITITITMKIRRMIFLMLGLEEMCITHAGKMFGIYCFDLG